MSTGLVLLIVREHFSCTFSVIHRIVCLQPSQELRILLFVQNRGTPFFVFILNVTAKYTEYKDVRK